MSKFWENFRIGEIAQWGAIFFRDIFRDAAQEGIKKELKGRGLSDEAHKEACVIIAQKKDLIDDEGAKNLSRIEEWLKGQAYVFFQNYCRVVEEMDNISKPAVKRTTTGEGKNKKTVEEIDPDWHSLGVDFLIDLSKLKSEDEWKIPLGRIGVFQKAPDGGIRTIFFAADWAKRKGLGDKLSNGVKAGFYKTKNGLKAGGRFVGERMEEAAEPTWQFSRGLVVGAFLLVAVLITMGLGVIFQLKNLM